MVTCNFFHYFRYKLKNRNRSIIGRFILFFTFLKWQDFCNFSTSGTYPVSNRSVDEHTKRVCNIAADLLKNLITDSIMSCAFFTF